MHDIISKATPDSLPRVVIVGRPNVGKSTLFNRLIGHRVAITDPTPGVTRDPVEARWEMDNGAVMLIDTGGYKLEHQDLDTLVTLRSLRTLDDADCIVLVLDVTEITPEDESFIERLRPFAERVIVAVNKVDHEIREPLVYNYHSFGFSRVVGISSAHGRGISELTDEIIKIIPEWGRVQEEEPAIRLAILGKPNTGKSTLLNRLCNDDRSIVSDIPGTTRDVVEGSFQYKHTLYKVLDTAGIRRRVKVTDQVEYYSVNRAIAAIERADIIFLLIDALSGLSDQDKKIAGLIVKRGRGVVMVLNKWDLMSGIANEAQAVEDRVRFLFPMLDFAPLVRISAREGEGIDNLLNTAHQVWKQLNRRVDTGELNRKLAEWTDHYDPPRDNRGQFRTKYMTQVTSNPVSFALFVNRPKGFPSGYLQYLKNRLRKDLGFTAIPLDIHLKG
ncbi:ribosome biogenesis GTPase Der [Marispirochaeta sp.]|jgi:GTPase|uniref:ribosome biogenesis GTPase Der n=1 Tax=Marispirochaeta sp. TaxID=2038653 RepID=UPI0029C931CC|nr:ribosome biogenesis GTPase Der [Marispirochaeta sp.]